MKFLTFPYLERDLSTTQIIGKKIIRVNSYHNYFIKALNRKFIKIGYHFKDNSIEMMGHAKYNFLCIIFHPERYSPDQKKVDKFIKNESNRRFKLITTYEKNLLGTAGTLISNKEIFVNSTCILIHADNFTTFNLKYLLDAHYKRPENCLKNCSLY